MDRRASRDSIQRTLDTLIRLAASRRLFAERMSAVGVDLSQPAVAVLMHVCDAGPLPMSRLATATRNDPGATARQVAALESDGLVVREQHSIDRRVHLVRATAEGREMCGRVAAAQTRHLDLALRDWSAGELAACADHLERLMASLRETDYREGTSTLT